MIAAIEVFAAPELQEEWDNGGLITGNGQWECTGVLCTLDVTVAVVQEAVAKGVNLIVAHHPIVFKGLKKLNGSNYVEQVVIEAIKSDIAIFASHTALDNVVLGVNGKIAQRLQLKDLFAAYNASYPVLVLRNSFLVIEEKWQKKISQLELSIADIFQSQDELMNRIVKEKSENPVSLNGNFEKATELFEHIKSQALRVDTTLSKHVAAIEARSLKALQELEKKMLRAEKRKFVDLQRQLEKLKAALFPNNGLQERVENFSLFYAKWGKGFIEDLYQHSLTLEQEFTVLEEQPAE
ncbi:MAG: bacillithiol biosynthesis BshC [Chitinophagaceae bacterium]|nr:MAG: bacillithiol biosynthesis BshC [Chitinophagaceae bacterium]